jgi:hypothetical protein
MSKSSPQSRKTGPLNPKCPSTLNRKISGKEEMTPLKIYQHQPKGITIKPKLAPAIPEPVEVPTGLHGNKKGK